MKYFAGPVDINVWDAFPRFLPAILNFIFVFIVLPVGLVIIIARILSRDLNNK